MSQATKWFTTLGFLILLVGIGTADALLTKGSIVLPPPVRRDGTPKPDPDIETVLNAKGFTMTETREQSLLGSVAPNRTPVESASSSRAMIDSLSSHGRNPIIRDSSSSH